MSEEELKYPVGRLEVVEQPTAEQRASWIDQLAEAPGRLRALVEDLDESRLNRTYRPDGWTIRQVVHHLADSHLNAAVRIRLALTEENPRIKTYDQTQWANLSDASEAPVSPSLQIVEGLHERLVALLRSLEEEQFEARLQHPEMGDITVDTMLQIYSWHGRHHLAHIENALGE